MGAKRSIILTFWGLVLLLTAQDGIAQFYAGSSQDFGKSRVQYQTFAWLYYPNEYFDVYHYQGGQEMAQYVLQTASEVLPEMETFFDFYLEERVQIVLYNKQSEFRQSNIGMTDAQDNLGGTNNIIGSKIFIYFEGSHEDLTLQIRKGLAEVLFNQMVYGGGWRDLLRSNTLVSIPDWYKEGVISYAADPNNSLDNSHIKDGILSNRYDNFNRLAEGEANYAGKSVWMYLAEVYGANVIPNILYMTRMTRSIESGFLVVLGLGMDDLVEDYKNYWLNRYALGEPKLNIPEAEPKLPNDQIKPTDAKALAKWNKKRRKWMGELPVKYKKKYRYSQFEENPDGTHVAFVTHQLGQYKIWLYEYATGKKTRVLKKEPKLDRIQDNSYPILTWHPLGNVLAFVYEDDARAHIGFYDLESEKKDLRSLFQIDKVIEFDYSPDGRRIVFSGVSEGQTDLYIYQMLGNNQSRVFKDVYDDMHPSFLDNNRIIFSSNRPDDTLRSKVQHRTFPLNKDIYILDVDKVKLQRITNTSEIDETKPDKYDDKAYTYLTNKSGVYNRVRAELDSVISSIDTTIHYRVFTNEVPLSSFSRSPLEYETDPADGSYSLVFKLDGKPYFASANIAQDQAIMLQNPSSNSGRNGGTNSVDIKSLPATRKEELEVDIDNYTFKGEREEVAFEKETIVIGADPNENDSSAAKVAPFMIPKARNYRLNFATDYVLTQVDNSFEVQYYQRLSSPSSLTPGLSGMFKVGASDLFEDKKIVGGVQLSGSRDNNTFGISFSDLTKRIDKQYSFQRQSSRQISQNSGIKVISHIGQYQLNYPINELHSIRGTGILRLDNAVTLSVEVSSLDAPSIVSTAVGAKLEYVFDNTRSRGLNLLSGMRYKVFGEYYQEPLIEQSDMVVLGLDVRHYLPIHRDLTLVTRFAGSTSLGNRRILYYLGGVDNWLFERVDETLTPDPDVNFYYQALVTPMRGFYLNARNGNSFAVANAEIRWPIFTYFSRKPVQSDFLQNFQIVGFSDVGSAWTGSDPWSDENRFNFTTISTPATTVTVNNNRDPLAFGYGMGVRSRLLGYYMRLDWSWGIDDRQVLPRTVYFSLNLDI